MVFRGFKGKVPDSFLFFFSLADPDIEGSEQIKTTTLWGVGVGNLPRKIKERHRLRKKT